jgi:ribonucleoside-diphosphate reductase alpha chain/ribonucleoside-triphosphate reductase
VGNTASSRDIVDIGNLIGKAVVSGGIRRSAEIALGDINDKDFVNLKDASLEENIERTGSDGWAWMSNNSVIVRDNDKVDYDWLAERVADKGEPGLFFLDKARQYGRMIDPITNRDRLNPKRYAIW